MSHRKRKKEILLSRAQNEKADRIFRKLNESSEEGNWLSAMDVKRKSIPEMVSSNLRLAPEVKMNILYSFCVIVVILQN
jgi:hypothetical protein